MARFAIGDSVQSINSNDIGVICRIYPKKPGKQLYDVIFESGQKKPALETTLIPVTDYDDPFDCCAKGIYGSNSDFACINTSHKIRNTNNNTISSLKASKTIFKAYQFKPLLKFLNSRNHRVLIADEVGLGKTIEAGHIMLELSARRELGNALIVCPKSLQEKWQTELRDKFGFDFTVYEAKHLAYDLQNKDGFVRGIVNYEKLRESENNKLFDILDNSYHKFDFVLCDEAHRLRNRGTLTHKGVARLLETPCAAVFLTATPVMISEENLFNLLNLLDPEQYGNYSVFLNSLAVNAPFISAISALNGNVAFTTIKQNLEEAKVQTTYTIGDESPKSFSDNSTVSERFKDSPLYQKIIRDLESGDESPETKVRLQFNLSSMSTMNNLFSRTRKKEVTTDWTQAERDTYTKIVHLDKDERAEFDHVINEYMDVDDEAYIRSSQGKALGLIQRKRQFSSSIYASLNNAEDLKNGVDRYACYSDAKVNELVRIAKALEAEGQKHLIVFAVFKNTLRYLAIRLSKVGFRTIQIHGDIKPDERIERLKNFKNAQEFSVLLSSEVGSEGLDMQFCNSMVNYDLPWNPMVVEQRIGRIDRFGQKSPKVHIYNLVVEDSIQVDIYERLLDRIGIFKNCIGDLEAILDKDLEQNGIRDIQEWFNKLEKELYCNKLSPEERREKIEAIAKAIVTENKNLEDVSEGLTNTLTNDAYFKKEIESIDAQNRYVTEQEVYNYIKLLIEKRLPSCILEPVDDDGHAFNLKIPHAQPRIISSFLEEFYPVGQGKDLEILNRQFRSRVKESLVIPLTFNQDVAYEHRELEFITAYHPLVTSAYMYFNKNNKALGKTFNFVLNKAELNGDTKNLSNEYYMGLFVLLVEKTMYGNTRKMERLSPVLYDAQKKCIVEDKELINSIFALSQSSSGLSQTKTEPVDSDLILNIKIDMEEKILELRKEYYNDQKMVIDTYKDMQMRQYKEFYNAQLSFLNETLHRHQNEVEFGGEEQRKKAIKILPIDKHNIEQKKAEMELTFETINSAEVVDKEHVLVSLSHIDIV